MCALSPQFIERGDKVRSLARACGPALEMSVNCACQFGAPRGSGHRRCAAVQLALKLSQLGAEPSHLRGQVTKYVEREILNHRSLMHPQCAPGLCTCSTPLLSSCMACARPTYMRTSLRLMLRPLVLLRAALCSLRKCSSHQHTWELRWSMWRAATCLGSCREGAA